MCLTITSAQFTDQSLRVLMPLVGWAVGWMDAGRGGGGSVVILWRARLVQAAGLARRVALATHVFFRCSTNLSIFCERAVDINFMLAHT